MFFYSLYYFGLILFYIICLIALGIIVYMIIEQIKG